MGAAFMGNFDVGLFSKYMAGVVVSRKDRESSLTQSLGGHVSPHPMKLR